MNRIDALFERVRRTGRPAFVAYLTAGDPDLATTNELVLALEGAGVDMIEYGMPFSDPIADGPTIQKASMRALRSGTTVAGVLDNIKLLRRRSQIPVSLFGAYNPFFRFGLERLVQSAHQAGVDGLLIPDLPPDEADELIDLCSRNDLKLTFLLAPTSSDERIRLVAEKSTGFIYYISLKGVTGARDILAADLVEKLDHLRRLTDKPVVVGFGISRPEQVRRVAQLADGVVVGSAFVRMIEHGANQPNLVEQVASFARELTGALPESTTGSAGG